MTAYTRIGRRRLSGGKKSTDELRRAGFNRLWERKERIMKVAKYVCAFAAVLVFAATALLIHFTISAYSSLITQIDMLGL